MTRYRHEVSTGPSGVESGADSNEDVAPWMVAAEVKHGLVRLPQASNDPCTGVP